MDDEKRLIQRIQKYSDRTAADTLIQMYYDEILIYTFRQTQDRHIAMDLTQGIFISMLKTIPSFDPKKAGFRTWLYKIATNKIIDFHRSRGGIRNKILNLDDLELPTEDDFTFQMENKELIQRINAYVGDFDAVTQRIFRMKVFGEYKFTEIAAITKQPEAKVKTRYYRLLKLIRKEFGHENHTG